MIELTAREYGQNMQLQLKSNNVITSAIVPEMQNTLGEQEVIATQTITNVIVNGTTQNLPIDPSTKATHYRCMFNTRSQFLVFSDYNFAKSRVECLMVSGTTKFHTSSPVDNLPTVQLRLSGKSYILDRGGNTFENYPSVDQLRNVDFDLASWVFSNANSTLQSLHEDYVTKINMNPWVNNIVNSTTTPSTLNDIRTSWYAPISGAPWFALYQDWQNESNINTDTEAFMLPAATDVSGDAWSASLKIGNSTMYVKTSVVRDSDTDFTVSWEVPVKYVYAAASRRRGLLGGTHDVDNFAFLDMVSQIDIDLVAATRVTDFIDKIISIKDSNVFGNQVTDKAMTLEKSEAITSFGRYTWPDGITSSLAGSIGQMLTYKYQKGKYICRCEVPVSWAIKNSLTIDSQVRIRLQDGAYVTHGTSTEPAIFKVQNILQKYSASKFIYEIQLMEV